MVGKIILWVLLGLLALLAAALLIPVKIRGSYEDGAPFLYIRYGPGRIWMHRPVRFSARPRMGGSFSRA